MKQMESIGEILGEHLSFAGKVVIDVGCGTGGGELQLTLLSQAL
jgi:hypothetical protein